MSSSAESQVQVEAQLEDQVVVENSNTTDMSNPKSTDEILKEETSTASGEDDQNTGTAASTAESVSSLQILLINPDLLSSLAKQLSYYFSPKNLAKDTYLNTIMSLNSGHVPISILANFANVNRIVARFSSDGTNVTHDDICALLRKAASQSSALNIVILNQSGKVVDHQGGDEQQEEGVRTFDGVGPSDGDGDDSTNSNAANLGEAADSTATAVTVAETKTDSTSEGATTPTTTSASSTANIVILREVPKEASEEDIRNVFDTNIILSVQKEVGDCWFVTLDTDNNSKQDLVTILLNLRSKQICNEPIKARLKTQSKVNQASSPGADNSSSGQFSGRYRGGSISGKKAAAVGGSASYKGSYNNNKPNQIYSGDRVHYTTRKYQRGPGPYSQYAGFNKHQQPRGGKGTVPLAKGQKEVKPINAVPPPPVVEEHYPSLAGESPKPVAADSGGDGGSSEQQGDVEKTASAPAATGSGGGGYAAALLKAASSNSNSKLTVSTTTSAAVTKTVTNVPPPSPSRSSKKKNETSVNFSSAKTSMTAGTDDCSSDDKSSLSSKPESDNMGATTPAVVWGGGRSFADIVKK